MRPATAPSSSPFSHSNYGDQRPLNSALNGPILVANLPFPASYGHVLDECSRPAGPEANLAFRHVLTAATPLLEGLIALLELRFSRVRLRNDGGSSTSMPGPSRSTTTSPTTAAIQP